MFEPGQVISYLEMCAAEGVNLQRGMNYHLKQGKSVILMSLRKGAPYEDRIEEDGKVLIYEGHDIARKQGVPDPKKVDQPYCNESGSLTQNGLFYEAAHKFKNRYQEPELVRVYEKVKSGIWVYNGMFLLTDAWKKKSGQRIVFKFKLELSPWKDKAGQKYELQHERIIPSSVKLEVWKRDKGRCVKCGSKTNLHFDHIIPFSKGGSSLTAENVQILCAKHNLEKRDKIE